MHEVKADTTSTEFMHWLEYLHEKEWKARTKLDFYMAQVACEVHNIAEYLFSKKPTPRKISDFLLDFSDPDEKKQITVKPTAVPEDELTPEEEQKLRKELAEEQRLAWADFLEAASHGSIDPGT